MGVHQLRQRHLLHDFTGRATQLPGLQTQQVSQGLGSLAKAGKPVAAKTELREVVFSSGKKPVYYFVHCALFREFVFFFREYSFSSHEFASPCPASEKT